MVGLVLLGAAAARADLAYREDLMRKGYFVCLARAGDEDLCLNRFGRLMWYPRDAEECEGVGARVDKVISLGGEPKWRDLFKNERCARRGLPHSVEAVNAGERAGPDGPYAKCDQGFANRYYCDEEFGGYLWYPHGDGNKSCHISTQFVGLQMEHFWSRPPPELHTGPDWARRKPPIWRSMFRNERCWRLGQKFHAPKLPR